MVYVSLIRMTVKILLNSEKTFYIVATLENRGNSLIRVPGREGGGLTQQLVLSFLNEMCLQNF